MTQQKINNLEVLFHPSYISDIVPSDNCLSQSLVNFLIGKEWRNEDVKSLLPVPVLTEEASGWKGGHNVEWNHW